MSPRQRCLQLAVLLHLQANYCWVLSSQLQQPACSSGGILLLSLIRRIFFSVVVQRQCNEQIGGRDAVMWLSPLMWYHRKQNTGEYATRLTWPLIMKNRSCGLLPWLATSLCTHCSGLASLHISCCSCAGHNRKKLLHSCSLSRMYL